MFTFPVEYIFQILKEFQFNIVAWALHFCKYRYVRASQKVYEKTKLKGSSFCCNKMSEDHLYLGVFK